MLIGHVPAGIITTHFLLRRMENSRISKGVLWISGIFGSVAPDLDMFYFHLIDNRQHHHHSYWSHWPSIWLLLLVISVLWFFGSRKRGVSTAVLIFAINGFVHLLLDSIVGDVWWLMPWIDRSFALATVPARFDHWWISFIVHWSFGVELLVVGWAGYVVRKMRECGKRVRV